jgi:hypothetical protein
MSRFRKISLGSRNFSLEYYEIVFEPLNKQELRALESAQIFRKPTYIQKFYSFACETYEQNTKKAYFIKAYWSSGISGLQIQHNNSSEPHGKRGVQNYLNLFHQNHLFRDIRGW